MDAGAPLGPVTHLAGAARILWRCIPPHALGVIDVKLRDVAMEVGIAALNHDLVAERRVEAVRVRIELRRVVAAVLVLVTLVVVTAMVAVMVTAAAVAVAGGRQWSGVAPNSPARPRGV